MTRSDFAGAVPQTWPELCRNAEYWQLDMAKFHLLKDFFAEIDKAFFLQCAEKVTQDFPSHEAAQRFGSGALEKFLLLCLIANYQNFREFYRREELPDSMFQAIRRDLPIWLETLEKDLGGYGLTPRIFEWEVACITGGVKQIGRLQFNDIHYFQPRCSIYRREDGSVETYPAFQKENPKFPFLTCGDKVVNLHIPADGPLSIPDCRHSIASIGRFVEERYPDYEYRALVCYSWLLDSQFRQLLPEKSNIVQFQDFGYCIPWRERDMTQEVIWRLWGNAGLKLSPEQLPVNNTMTREVARFLRNGGHFHVGILVIPRECIAGMI